MQAFRTRGIWIKFLLALAFTGAAIAQIHASKRSVFFPVCRGVCTTNADCSGCLCSNPSGKPSGGGCVRQA